MKQGLPVDMEGEVNDIMNASDLDALFHGGECRMIHTNIADRSISMLSGNENNDDVTVDFNTRRDIQFDDEDSTNGIGFILPFAVSVKLTSILMMLVHAANLTHQCSATDMEQINEIQSPNVANPSHDPTAATHSESTLAPVRISHTCVSTHPLMDESSTSILSLIPSARRILLDACFNIVDDNVTRANFIYRPLHNALRDSDQHVSLVSSLLPNGDRSDSLLTIDGQCGEGQEGTSDCAKSNEEYYSQHGLHAELDTVVTTDPNANFLHHLTVYGPVTDGFSRQQRGLPTDGGFDVEYENPLKHAVGVSASFRLHRSSAHGTTSEQRFPIGLDPRYSTQLAQSNLKNATHNRKCRGRDFKGCMATYQVKSLHSVLTLHQFYDCMSVYMKRSRLHYICQPLIGSMDCSRHPHVPTPLGQHPATIASAHLLYQQSPCMMEWKRNKHPYLIQQQYAEPDTRYAYPRSYALCRGQPEDDIHSL